MSNRVPSSSLSRFYPTILVIAGVGAAIGCKTLYDYYTTRKNTPDKRSLRRRNARRHRNNPANNANAATAETLSFLDGTNVRPTSAQEMEQIDGIQLPQDEALTTMLNNAGAAARDNREDVNDSEFSYASALQPRESQENQNVLQLLYLIAEDQAKQQGYVHRGVTCNACNTMPIRGIRYRCSNCIDFDLCESCEAQDIHPKTHLFYKVRIPAPFLGNPKKIQAPVYPGKPHIMPPNLPPDVSKRLHKETGIEQAEVDALYEQFKCLAATEFPGCPNGLNGAINRQTFDKCFVPNNSLRPPPPNLIYDRMFVYYDTDQNGLIGFEEFIQGISIKNKRSSQTTANIVAKHRRTFKAYDLNEDGYIERKDVLRMYRSFYALQKDLVKDLIAGIDDDVYESQSSNVVLGSQPISAAFAGMIPRTDRERPQTTKSPEDVDNDVARNALSPDGNERGRRSETLDRALAEHRADVAEEQEKRRRAREEERLARDSVAASVPEGETPAPGETPAQEEARLLRAIGTVLSREFGDDLPSQRDQELELALVRDGQDIATINVPTGPTWQRDQTLELPMDESQLSLDALHPVPVPLDRTPEQSNIPENFPSFDIPEDWTTELHREEQPGRQATEEERALYYLDDYYESGDEEEEQQRREEGTRKRQVVKAGLEKEEDVGREILCQVVEQGINQLLDHLFLVKEQDGLSAWRTEQIEQQEKAQKLEKTEETDVSEAFCEEDPSHDVEVKAGNDDLSVAPSPPLSPSRDPLIKIREETKERNGPGKISEDEFLAIMQTDVGRKLLFMSTWINMGSF